MAALHKSDTIKRTASSDVGLNCFFNVVPPYPKLLPGHGGGLPEKINGL